MRYEYALSDGNEIEAYRSGSRVVLLARTNFTDACYIMSVGLSGRNHSTDALVKTGFNIVDIFIYSLPVASDRAKYGDYVRNVCSMASFVYSTTGRIGGWTETHFIIIDVGHSPAAGETTHLGRGAKYNLVAGGTDLGMLATTPAE